MSRSGQLPSGTRKQCHFCGFIAVRGMEPVIRIDRLLIGWRCRNEKACVARVNGKRYHYNYSAASGRLIKSPMDPAQHGTVAGNRAHYRRGEKPCEACRKASQRYYRDRKAAADAAVRSDRKAAS